MSNACTEVKDASVGEYSFMINLVTIVTASSIEGQFLTQEQFDETIKRIVENVNQWAKILERRS